MSTERSRPMSAESTDRLYDEGCCLCGSLKWNEGSTRRLAHLRDTGRENPGAAHCEPCFDRLGSHDAIDAEITRRKSLVPRPAPTETFRVGDRVVCLEHGSHGKEIGGEYLGQACGKDTFYSVIRRDDGGGWSGTVGGVGYDGKNLWHVPTEHLRRPAPPPLAPGSEKTTSAENGSGAPSRVAPNETTPSGHSPATPKLEHCDCCGKETPGLSAGDWCASCKRQAENDPLISERAARARCNQPACPCPYCRHRPHSRILGAADPRYNDGKGPTHSTIDQSIALAKAQHLSDLDRSSSSRREALSPARQTAACVWERRVKRVAFVDSRPAPWESEE